MRVFTPYLDPVGVQALDHSALALSAEGVNRVIPNRDDTYAISINKPLKFVGRT